MGYSNYRQIKNVVKKFNLDMRLIRLFAEDVENVEPSGWLLETLEMAKGTPITSEKSKSERIVSPILLEASKHYTDRISFFSGEALNVTPEDDLAGECDFFFSLQSPKPYFEVPIISLISMKKIAKDEDKSYGIAQCAAQMFGAKFFNESEGKNIPMLFGCATDGIDWQFMKLENDIYYVDNKIFTDLREILGVWHHIIKLYL